MAIQPLLNDRWGFESNCFVCEQRNDRGLRIPFFHDDTARTVFGEFTLGDEFSGAPAYVHGGVTLAVLDEAQAWAAIALGGKFAVTHTTRTVFERPVRVGVRYRVEARLVDETPARLIAEASVLDERGGVRASSQAELVVVSAAHAIDVIGAEVTGNDTGFVR